MDATAQQEFTTPDNPTKAKQTGPSSSRKAVKAHDS